MKTVCYCADDFALNPAVSAGILKLLATGRIHATSCMTQSALWPSAATQLRQLAVVNNRTVEIGLHLNFTHRFDAQDYIMPLGQLMRSAWMGRLNRAQIKACIAIQWQNFIRDMGRAPDFVDGHQHVHQFPMIREELVDFLQQQQFQGWVRSLHQPITIQGYALKSYLLKHLGALALQRLCQQHQIRQNHTFAGIYSFQTPDYAALNRQILARATDGLLVMCHPASADTTNPNAYDSIATARIQEFDYFQSQRFVDDCAAAKVQLQRLGVRQ